MSKIYEIDPDADTLVVVRPLAEFAAWPDRAAAAPSSSTVSVSKTADVRIKVSGKHLSLASPRFRDLLAQAQAQATASATNGTSGLFAPKSSCLPPPPPHGLASPPATPTKSLWRREAPASPTLSVTSTASSTASTASTMTATTAHVDPADGRVHIAMDGVDADAVKTVLNIVHGRAGKDRVPRTVTLDALARIAVVVDRFRLQDAVEIYADRWVDALYRQGIPTAAAVRRDLVLWIYIGYVFQRDAIFKEATQIAATQLTGPLLPVVAEAALANLPLRARIVQAVDAQREAVLAQSLAVLAAAVDRLATQTEEEAEADAEADNENSNTDTNAYLLGSLIRALRKHKLYWPQPAAPFEGLSIAGISRAARDVQTEVWRSAARRTGTGTGASEATHSNRLLLLPTPQLDSLRASVAGLELKSELGFSLY